MNKISIQELSEEAFEDLEKNGHIGIRTKNIAELQSFYSAIEDERKRRNLRLREIQKMLPINEYFRTVTSFGTFLFQVIECKSVNNPENMHITHYCHIRGIKIYKNKLIYFDNAYNDDWCINDAIEFGWNSKWQKMIFWVKGDIAPFEVFTETEDSFKEFMCTLDLLGFDE